jgi:hypothetical protein
MFAVLFLFFIIMTANIKYYKRSVRRVIAQSTLNSRPQVYCRLLAMSFRSSGACF